MKTLSAHRLMSLDVFRGITIAGMILVNNPGSWASIYAPLKHATWHGWTPTDLIFPFFLFIVGVSIVFALSGKIENKLPVVHKIFRRGAIMFGLGLLMAAYPFFQFEPEFMLHPKLATLRIMGVLQRTALCYVAASLLYLYIKPKYITYIIIGSLLFYWLIMTLVPVPGYGVGRIDLPEGNLAAYIDRVVFGEHLWAGADRKWDPEGLLSTIPAIATVLFGVRSGRVLRSRLAADEKVIYLLGYGCLLVMVGYCWDWFFPVNKNLWTSSYVVLTAGMAMCGLGLCYYFIDLQMNTSWAFPFKVYGVNAIIVFVLSGLLSKTLSTIKIPLEEGESISLSSFLYKNCYEAFFSPLNASLLYALTWVTGWFLILWWMYRKNIIVKI